MKSFFKLPILLMMSAFFISCDMTSSQKEEENSLMTGDVREIVPENQVVVRDYTRVLNTDLLAKIKSAQTRRSRGMQEDETSDFVTLQAEEELLDFYTEMPEELKIGFEEACANDDVKIEYHYLTTVELENQTDLTSDYIQAKIAEGEMLKEIENNFMEEDLILTANEDVDVEKDLSVMELYNDSNSRNKRINIKKYLSYRKPENSRSALASNEVKVNAASVVHFLALLNYQDEVMEIAKLLDKDIDIKKIRNYHKKLNSMTSRSSSSSGSYYDNDLITDDEIKNKLLKTGQIICRVSKLKSKGCIYGTYDHAGLIDLRNWITDKGEITADNSTLCVFSAYPTTSKGDLQGDRMPEHLGYPSFEPLKNFTNGEKIAILEPLETSDSEMETAVAYTINKYDDKEDDINFMYSFPGNIYCSYMPYAGYKSIGINLNSDVKNQYPTLDCFRVWLDLLTGFPVYSIARACAGTIITPDDIYNSSSDQKGYAWFRVWVPTGYWS
ncbi:MAG: hypothetical protein II196_05085, partial [Spirochaetales bacterium]|nr:hypothetical protein [Spirochaetales bacterium]